MCVCVCFVALYQDYMRCQQAPICSESKQLPDFDTLKDRMSLIAYDSGLMNGVDKAASSLALIALEVHLKTLLGDLLSLIRSDRSVATPADSALSVDQTQVVESNSQTHIEPPIASTSARPYSSPSDRADQASSPSKPVPISLANQAFQASSNLRLRDLKTQGLAPHLTSRDVAALAEISPPSRSEETNQRNYSNFLHILSQANCQTNSRFFGLRQTCTLTTT